jgi:hypothetical protein
MMTAEGWARSFERVAVALLWAGAFTFVLSLWLLHGRAFNTLAPAGIDKLIDGGASRPYSARLLVPWIARAAVSALPVEERVERIDRWAQRHPAVEPWLAYFQVSRRRAFELLAAALIDALALAGFLWSVRRLVEAFYETSIWVARLAPVVAVLLLPLFFGAGTHFIYDLPALFFAAAALLAVRRGSVHALTVVLGLGTLNKETMALALLVYLLPSFRKALGARWRSHLAVQSLVVVLARGLAVAFSSPAGDGAATNNYLRNYLLENLVAFVRDPFLLSYARTAALIFFALLIFAGLGRKPVLLREAFPIALPFLALYAWGSQWSEIRVLYEAYPIVFLMGYQSCVEWIGLPIVNRDGRGAVEAAARSEPPRLAPSLASALAGLFLAACGAMLPFLVTAGFAG